uniref:C18-delta6 desaturase protein n=1 Tax=Pythium sp. BCC53698 TaxID=1524452 RepID=A0A0F6TLZ2_9STRA|nr:C18-delta6 desaturase protein [Pythium sp. BCC53698]ALE65995.1 delta6 desaturase protein [synthetic construct]
MVDPKPAARKISWREVREHGRYDNAWVVIHHKVYDISQWDGHPGGKVMLSQAGEDATDSFAVFHPASAYKLLEPLYVGDVDESTAATESETDSDGEASAKSDKEARLAKQKEFMAAYRRLRVKVKGLGLYDASYTYYAWKILSTFAICMASVALAKYANGESTALIVVAACIMGLFWQQSGWLAHDVLHHQVWDDHYYGNLVGVVVGNVWQGFSCQWWKNKHNFHHAVPNLVGDVKTAYLGDPDIDTMPLLAWSKHMASQAFESPIGPFMIRHQAVLYFPLLLLARFSWVLQSYLYVFKQFAFGRYDPVDFPRGEKIGLLVHYAWMLALPVYANMSLVQAVIYHVTAQMFCGLLLALVFSIGHNGMSVYERESKPDFWQLQVTTTRNITPSLFMDWFTGGLNYQIDHHLFPLMPRHNLAKVNPLIKSLCKEHGVHFHETGFWTGISEVVDQLADITHEFITEFPAM